MIQYARRLVTLLLPLAVCLTASAQNWPLPSKNARTTVPCVGCSNTYPDAFTVGYEPGINFVGRYLDSNNTSDYQGTFRTARANSVRLDSLHNRVYMRIGSAIFAYDRDTFFQRLIAGDSLMASTSFPVSPANGRLGAPEIFLKPDEYFYPEYSGSKWKTVTQDGQDRVYSFDVDEEGYVYVAASIYGWGIVQDKMTKGGFSLMPTLVQKFPTNGAPGSVSPFSIIALKGQNRRLAFASPQGQVTVVFDVTNRNAPNFLTKLPIGIQWFAKTTDQRTVAVIDYNNVFRIYDADSFADGGTPLFTEEACRGVGTDGTKFYTSKSDAGGVKLLTLSPSGTGWSRQAFSGGSDFQVWSLQQSEGFIVLSGLNGGAWDTRLYKLSGGVPSAIEFKSFPAAAPYTSYFTSYYAIPPVGTGVTYVKPFLMNLLDGTVVKSAGRSYLVLSGLGLGDVYEIPGSSSVNITATTPGAINPYTPAARNANIYYSDKVQFTGATTEPGVSSISWNFGNPECSSCITTETTAVGAPTQPFQYSQLNASTIKPKTVTATALEKPDVTGSYVVNLTMPTASFKIANKSFLFTQPNASSPAPIVIGDQWVDTSDGRVESHYSAWSFDGQPVKQLPNQPLSVGPCGVHTVSFQAVYGPYNESTLTPTGTPLVLGMGGSVGYAVRPFAAAVEVDTAASTATTLAFRSGSQNGSAQNLLYKFELLNGDGSVSTAVQPLLGGGLPTALYSIPRSVISGRGMRVRLTLTSTDTFTGCSGIDPNTSVALSQPLNGPDPAAPVLTGTCNGAPCSLTVNSSSGVDPVADGWTYTWQVSDPSAVSASSYTERTFNPSFIKVGTFTVTVKVKNAISETTSAPVTVVVTTATSVCAPLTAQSFNVAWNGLSSGCPAGNCVPNETVRFTAGSLLGFNGGYEPSCAAHTITWSFGDGTAAPAPVTIPAGGSLNAYPVDHVFSSNGTFTVTMSVSNGSASKSYSASVVVGSTAPPPPPPPPPPTCASAAAYVSYAYSAPSGGSGCSSNNSTLCKTSETLSFSASYSGTTSCSNTYTWEFGDGSATVSGASATHAYATAGTWAVRLGIKNSDMSQTGYKTFYVTTGTGTSGQCGTITPNVSLWIDYHNASNTCNALSVTGCAPGDALTFAVKDYMPYNISCATHTYDWDFGDGSTHANTNTTNHAYGAPGTYTAKCVVSNGPQSVTLSQVVQIGGSVSPGKPDVTLDFTATALSQTTGAYVYLFTPSATPAGIVTRYSWSFGDGKSENVPAPGITSHLYPDGSKRSVTVTAFDAQGNSWTHTDDVPTTLPRRRGVSRAGH